MLDMRDVPHFHRGNKHLNTWPTICFSAALEKQIVSQLHCICQQQSEAEKLILSV